MRLVSLTDVKLFLEKQDLDHDVLLTLIIEHVSSWIEAYLNRELLKQERTAYFDAGRKHYYLSAYPIDETAPLTVTYGGIIQLKNTTYFVRANDGLIEFHNLSVPIYYDPKEIVITWTGGYSVGSGTGVNECLSVPVPIQEAALRQSVYNFRRRKEIGVSSVSMPDGSVSKTPTTGFLLQEVRDLLKNFRRPPGVY